MECIEDYDCTIIYHPRKANVDALSRKSLNSNNGGRIALLRKLRGFKAVLNARIVGNC